MPNEKLVTGSVGQYNVCPVLRARMILYRPRRPHLLAPAAALAITPPSTTLVPGYFFVVLVSQLIKHTFASFGSSD